MVQYLHVVDYVIVVCYLLATLAIGFWSARSTQTTTSAGYFLAGRRMSWFTIGLSLFMTNIGSNTIIGTAGAAAANGIGVLCYEYAAFFSYLLLAYGFIPIYRAAGVFTLPEYMQKRFNSPRLRLVITAQTLIMYIFAYLSLEVYAGVMITENLLGWNKYVCVVVLLVFTALFTVVGGLTTVLITDTVQGIVMICGASIVAVLSLIRVGGYGAMRTKYALSYTSNYNVSTGCGAPDPQAFHMLRDIREPNYPWLGSLIGANILSAWNFCASQLYTQRTLAARSLAHAQGGCLFAGFIKILPLMLMIWPGMISRILYTDKVGCFERDTCEDACGIAEGCTNMGYVEIMKDVLPIGLRGVMVAAMMAALVSSITSILNSGTTVFTVDVWSVLRPKATQAERMIISRLFVCLLTLIAVLWMPIVSAAGGGQIVIYVQTVTAHITPPIFAAFIVALFWRRATERGTFWGLLCGLLVGCVRLCLIFSFPPPQCGTADTRPSILADVHFLHFTIILFVFTAASMTGLSLVTPADDATRSLAGLTWFTKETKPLDDQALQNTNIHVDDLAQPATKPIDDDAVSEKEVVNTLEVATYTRLGRFALRWLCGVEESSRTETASEPLKNKANVVSNEQSLVEEPPWARTVIAVFALCLFGLGSFLWGFFA